MLNVMSGPGNRIGRLRPVPRNHAETEQMEERWERRADERRRAITAIHSMVDMRLDPKP